MSTRMFYFVSFPSQFSFSCLSELTVFARVVDQPAGTGYSYVTKNDNVRELAESAEQVVNFLQNLYKIFPEYSTMDVSQLLLSRLRQCFN